MCKFIRVLVLFVFWCGNANADMKVYKYGEVPSVKELQGILIENGININRGTKSRLGKSKAPTIGGEAIISIPIMFAYNSYRLKNDADTIQTLENLSMVLQNGDIKLIIEGHTDAVGGKEYNLALSMKRASTVKAYLLKKGVEESNLITRGMGYQKPLPGTDPTDAENRRVQFRFTN